MQSLSHVLLYFLSGGRLPWQKCCRQKTSGDVLDFDFDDDDGGGIRLVVVQFEIGRRCCSRRKGKT
jgi:hypothetical protein